MSLQGATQAVAAGAVSATVAATLPATYQVGIGTSWVTSVQVSAKTAAGFTLTFGTPVPPGGGTFDWTAGVPVTPDSGASQAITAAAVTVTITGAFASVYQVALGPQWLTDYEVTSQTATQFVVTFGTPAPGLGSTLDWIAGVPVNTISAVVPTTPIASASQAIAAGETTLAVTTLGSLPLGYEVTVAPSWVTPWQVGSRTTTGFVITFGAPVPPGGGTVYWIIFGPQLGVVTLSDYLDELRDLLHDPNDRFWSAAQKARYINRALLRRDIDTGVNRSTFTFTLTTGTGSYTLAQVNGRIFDVISITLIFGTTRCVLNQVSLTELNIRYRPQTTFTGWTSGFARQNQTIIFGPTPSQAFVTEWDCASYALPLINLTDTDPLPYPYTQPVPYFAAYQAKINEREGGERDDFFNAYMELIGLATNGRVGRLPNAYGGLGRS